MTMVGVYRHLDANGRTLYIGASANPGARYDNHRSVSEWALDVTRIEIEWHRSREAAYAAERAAIFAERPPHNKEWQKASRSNWRANHGQVALFEWMSAFHIGIDEFADRLGVSQPAAREFVVGVKHPRRVRKAQICVATDGFVPMDVWYSPSRIQFSPPRIGLPKASDARENFDRAVDRIAAWRGQLPPHGARILLDERVAQ